MKIVQSEDKYVHGAWVLVEEAIRERSNEEGILFYTFLEDVFNHSAGHPNLDNIIENPWVGITHNPIRAFESTKEERHRYNGEGFLKSMANCKGLFCMSTNESEKWKKYLITLRDSPDQENLNKAYDFTNIKIETLLFPARHINARFSWEGFCKNKKKRLHS